MDTPATPAGQLTFGSTEELDAWLATATGTAEELARVVYPAVRRFYTLDWHTKTFHRIRKRGSDDEVNAAITAAEIEWKAAAAAEAKAEAARRESEAAKRADALARQRAEEEKLRKAADRHKARVGKVMERFGVSRRRAQQMLRDKVRDRKRAEELAELLGGNVWQYMVQAAKPGRKGNPAVYMMRATGDGLTFHDFAEDDIDLTGEPRIAAWGLLEDLEDFRDFESLLSAARRRGIDPDTAHHVWLAFMLWRIRAVADRAEQSVRDKLDTLLGD